MRLPLQLLLVVLVVSTAFASDIVTRDGKIYQNDFYKFCVRQIQCGSRGIVENEN